MRSPPCPDSPMRLHRTALTHRHITHRWRLGAGLKLSLPKWRGESLATHTQKSSLQKGDRYPATHNHFFQLELFKSLLSVDYTEFLKRTKDQTM